MKRTGAQLLSVLALGVLAGAAAGCHSHTMSQPLADQRNLIDEVRIDQEDINNGSVSFENLFYAGKHIFSNRFTTDDAYGEGPEGPRMKKYSYADREGYPFLRFNGLDSQSCLECHSVIGFASQRHADDGDQVRFIKQPGITGGGAGFASNAFGLENFACEHGQDNCDTTKASSGFVRSPPHAFGAGYTQQLAEEMTWDLETAREAAAASPGTAVALESKGVSFGHVVTDADGNIDMAQSDLQGVSEDLIVRPFQWKGLTSNLRNFITGAMNFHFSIQPAELKLEGTDKDDLDNVSDEVKRGEITAVAAFLAMLRPPIESHKGLPQDRVERGREVFDIADCSSCHRPSLKMEGSYVSIRDPENDKAIQATVKPNVAYAFSESGQKKSAKPTLAEPYGVLAPAVEKFAIKKAFKEKVQNKQLNNQQFYTMLAQEFQGTFGGFVHDLNDASGPPETLPRLPQNAHGTVDVPLYSDLKRHTMGTNLQEVSFPEQETDGGKDVTVPAAEFLTRPLWGVADTGPWLHDGRALTLKEAILMHEGTGSDANPSIQKYKDLSDADQEALRAFLSSLRLPKFKPCHWWCG